MSLVARVQMMKVKVDGIGRQGSSVIGSETGWKGNSISKSVKIVE
jgi:hypothetical protein